MVQYLEAINIIRKSINFYNDIRTMINNGSEIKDLYQKLTTISVDSRDDLISGFAASKIDYKDHIKITGKLIDFAHLYKPKSYINSIDVEGDSSNGDDFGELILSMSWKPFQLPVSKIPAVETESGLLCLSFLYPTTFQSFIYDGINGFVGGPLDRPTFKVPESAKPIPILLRKEDAVRFQFKTVEIVGQVLPLSDELFQKFISNPFSSMVFSDIVNPFNTQMPSLSLNATTNKSYIKELHKADKLESCQASIFMETHIEGQVTEKLLAKIPDVASLALTNRKGQYSETDDPSIRHEPILQYNTGTKVNVIHKMPNTIGFYIEGNLQNIDQDYKQFLSTFNRFSQGLHDRVPNLTLHVDFMHDYNFKSYVENPILNSFSTKSITHPQIKETIDWLKND